MGNFVSMRRFLGAVFAFGLFIVGSTEVLALNVKTLSAGDTVYIDGAIVGFNTEVEVIKVNQSSNKAYVYDPDAEEYHWVHGDNLIGWFDKTERNLDQISTIIDIFSSLSSSKTDK